MSNSSGPTELHPVRAATDDLGRDAAVVYAFTAAFAIAERWGSGTVNYVHLSQGCWPDIEKKMVASMSALGNWRSAPWLQTLRLGHLDYAGLGEIAAIRDELTREGLDFRWAGQPVLGDLNVVHHGMHGLTLSTCLRSVGGSPQVVLSRQSSAAPLPCPFASFESVRIDIDSCGFHTWPSDPSGCAAN